MTFLVPVAIGGGVLLLAIIGKRKQKNATASQVIDDPPTVLSKPAYDANGVADPTSPALKMGDGASKKASAPVSAPVMRGTPPTPPPTSALPVSTARAPLMGTSPVTTAAALQKRLMSR